MVKWREHQGLFFSQIRDATNMISFVTFLYLETPKEVVRVQM